MEHEAHCVAARGFVHVITAGEIVGFRVDTATVACPCRDIVHLHTETEVVETDFAAELRVEVVAEGKAAELHVVGVFYGSVTDSAGRYVAAVFG